jgi:hypothetical protein
MNSRNTAKWCREFEGGRSGVSNKIRSGKLSVVTDEIIQKTDESINADKRSTINKFFG